MLSRRDFERCGALLRVDIVGRPRDVDQPPSAKRDKVVDYGRRARRIVEMDFGMSLVIAARIDQQCGQPPGQGAGKLLAAEMRRHDDETIDSAAHGPKGIGRLLAAGVQVGQQEQIAAPACLAVHSTHDLRKELAVKVGEHDSDCVGACKAEAAGARMTAAAVPNSIRTPATKARSPGSALIRAVIAR